MSKNYLTDKETFLGNPKITKQSNSKDLRPILFTSCARKIAEPFQVPNLYGYNLTIKRSDNGSTVLDKDKPIASYDGSTLVVSKKYRNLGIGTALVIDFRTKHPEVKPAQYRTKASQHVQEKAWDQIQKNKLNESYDPDDLDEDDKYYYYKFGFDKLPSVFPIWRILYLDPEENPRLDNLGIHWFFKKEAIHNIRKELPKLMDTKGKKEIILQAMCPKTNVEWAETFYHYIDYSENNENPEYEITIYSPSNLYDVQIISDKEFPKQYDESLNLSEIEIYDNNKLLSESDVSQLVENEIQNIIQEELLNEIGNTTSGYFYQFEDGDLYPLEHDGQTIIAYFKTPSKILYEVTLRNIKNYLEITFGDASFISHDDFYPETNKGEMYKVMGTIVSIVHDVLKISPNIIGIRYYSTNKKRNTPLETDSHQRNLLYKAFIEKQGIPVKIRNDDGTIFATFLKPLHEELKSDRPIVKSNEHWILNAKAKNPCFICGKETKNPLWILLDPNDQPLHKEEFKKETIGQGYVPIGKSCLKKHPELIPYIQKEYEPITENYNDMHIGHEIIHDYKAGISISDLSKKYSLPEKEIEYIIHDVNHIQEGLNKKINLQKCNKFNFILGKKYSFDELPTQVQYDVDQNFNTEHMDLEYMKGEPFDYYFQCVLLSPKQIKNILKERNYFQYFGDYKRRIAKLKNQIIKNGLDYPPVGLEGNYRLIVYYLINESCPYLKMIKENNIQEANVPVSFQDDIDKIVAVINDVINLKDNKHEDRFDYTNNKKSIQAKLIHDLSVYNYDKSVLKCLLTKIFSFLNALESENSVPRKFVRKEIDFFDCKLSQHWNNFEDAIVKCLQSNVKNDNPIKGNFKKVLNDDSNLYRRTF